MNPWGPYSNTTGVLPVTYDFKDCIQAVLLSPHIHTYF